MRTFLLFQDKITIWFRKNSISPPENIPYGLLFIHNTIIKFYDVFIPVFPCSLHTSDACWPVYVIGKGRWSHFHLSRTFISCCWFVTLRLERIVLSERTDARDYGASTQPDEWSGLGRLCNNTHLCSNLHYNRQKSSVNCKVIKSRL